MSRSPTNSDIYQAIGELQGAVAGALARMEKLDRRMNAHSERLGRLERWQARAVGVAGTLGALIGGTLTAVAPTIAKKLGIHG